MHRPNCVLTVHVTVSQETAGSLQAEASLGRAHLKQIQFPSASAAVFLTISLSVSQASSVPFFFLLLHLVSPFFFASLPCFVSYFCTLCYFVPFLLLWLSGGLFSCFFTRVHAWMHDFSERKKEILKGKKSVLIMFSEVPHILFLIILVMSLIWYIIQAS